MSKIVRAEAFRTASGVIAAKHRKAPADATILLDAYLEFAKENGVKDKQAFFMLFGAAIHWASQLVTETAEERHIDVEQVLHEIGTAAARWSPT